MVAPKIQVRGAKELRRAIKQAEASDLKAELKKANKAAAEIVSYEAQTIVPVVSSRLLESIRPAGTQTAGIVRAGRANVPYAGVIHFGRYFPTTGTRQAPNTFLYDAADSRVDEVVAQYEEAIEAITKRLSEATRSI